MEIVYKIGLLTEYFNTKFWICRFIC